MSMDDADEEAYKEFLASASEEDPEDEKEEVNKDLMEEYRQKLLGSLSDNKKDGGDISSVFKTKDHQQGSDEDELDVQFTSGFGEDLGKKIIKDKKDKRDKKGESAWEKYQLKRKEKKKDKKQKFKEAKEAAKHTEEPDSADEDTQRRRAELTLLVGEKRNGVKGEFKGNTSDGRFDAVLGNKDFSIDPTHRNFRKVADGEFIKEQKIKRRKLHANE